MKFRTLRGGATLRALFFTLASAGAISAFALPARAEAPLWVVRDADSTVYLFGSVHVLRPELVWRSAKIDKALAESGELWLEATDLDDQAAAAKLFQAHGLDPAPSLYGKLDEADRIRLKAAAEAAGLPPQLVERMRPWFAALTLAVAPLAKAGYRAEAGVEMKLKAEAAAAGKPLRAFETMESQILGIAAMPEDVQLAYLKEGLREYEQVVPYLDDMAKAWAAGDVRRLESLVAAEFDEERPEVRETLNTRRNAAWADILAERMRGSGVSFVAVGAAHLVGPDSVQAMLAKKGIRVERR